MYSFAMLIFSYCEVSVYSQQWKPCITDLLSGGLVCSHPGGGLFARHDSELLRRGRNSMENRNELCVIIRGLSCYYRYLRTFVAVLLSE